MKPTNRTKAQRQASLSKSYYERIRSLVGDGYLIRFMASTMDGYYAWLRHRENGREVRISARLNDCSLEQSTRGVVTHSEVF